MGDSHKRAGRRFGVYNGDAKGTVKEITSQNVTYVYDHAPETVHLHSRQWFDSSTYGLDTDN